ncbi:g8927 [Coccomyxa elongata]
MPSAETLMYVHDVVGLPWDIKTFAAAAMFGNIDCLSYAYASRCPCNSKTCASAAEAGSLRCLAYAHQHECETIGKLVLYSAASSGQLECLKYAHTHGGPYIASRPFVSYWSGRKPYLPSIAVIGSSIACLAYVHEAMSCAWDIEGSECKLAFETGKLELLQYIHSHGGNLCTLSELPCPDNGLNAVGADAERKAMCLLFVHCYGVCRVKNVWHTKPGHLALEAIKARRVAVLLSFRTAGTARVEGPWIAAAHAAMQRMPSHLVWDIMCAAGLQKLE